MAKSDKPQTRYIAVLHPKRGYTNCGYGDVLNRRWRGKKQFHSLSDALIWIDKVRGTMHKHKRPWRAFQVLQHKNYETETLIFAYMENETIVI